MFERDRWGRDLALTSLLATLAIAVLGAGEKVRIDARAHLESADGRYSQARAQGTAQDLEAAGETYARAIASCTPFDTVPELASGRLLAVARELLVRHEPRAALRVLEIGTAAIDSCGRLFHPLAAEREEIEQARRGITLTHPATNVGASE